MGKPFHFNLLYKLFVDENGKSTNNWTRVTLGTKSKHKWTTLKEYILSSVDSHQYGEFIYLLTHNWIEPLCPHCGNKLKYNYGYKTYCSRKCSRANQHTEKESAETRKRHRNEIKIKNTISLNELSSYDNQYVNKLVYEENGILNFSNKIYTIRTSVSSDYANIIYWLNNRISWAETWAETLYCVYHNITEQPKCKVCGKPAIFRKITKGYSRYCSTECITKDEDIKLAISKKNIENGEERGKKVSIAKRNRTREQVLSEIQKSKNTRKILYNNENYVNVEQTKKTNLIKWKHVCTLHSPFLKGTYINQLTEEGRKRLSEFKKSQWEDPEYRKNTVEKIRNAQKNLNEDKRMSKLAGYYRWLNSLTEDERHEHNINVSKGLKKWASTLTEEQKQHKLDEEYKTKKKNNTFNKSKPEDKLAEYIWTLFPDMKRQYRSTVYPTKCDYYIPCIDTYIELQGSWTHGYHPYGTQEDDKETIKEWKYKNSIGKTYYGNAIHTWIISDVKKRNTAKINNLNFYELWPDDNYIEFINKLYEEYKRNC